jgi:hypothetical protein
MGVLFFLAGVILLVTAGVQAADALGKLEVRSYPFVKSESTALKWAYVSWLIIGALVAIGFGVFVR